MSITKKSDIGIILLLSFLVSIVGINYGMPYFFVSDEESIVGGALRMMEQKNLFPFSNPEQFKILNYPPLLPYFYILFIAPVFGIHYLIQGMPASDIFSISVFGNIDIVWMLSRMVSVIFSVATVYVIYRLSALLFKYRISVVVATILFSAEFYHVFLSHFSRHWSATVFFIWLTVLISWMLYNNPTRKKYIFLGVSSGLGFATSFIGSLGLVSTLILHFKKYKLREILNVNTITAALVFVFIALTFSLLYPQAVLRYISPETVLPIGDVKNFDGYVAALKFYSGTLYDADPVLLIFYVLGLVALTIEKEFKKHLVLLLGVMGYVLFLYFYMPLEDRYIMPVLPVMCLAGGFFIDSVMLKTEFNKSARKMVIAVVGLILIFPVVISFQISKLLFADDTRIQAVNWIKDNISSGEKIVVDLNTVRLSPTKAALEEQRFFDNNYLSRRDAILLEGIKNGIDISEYGFYPQYHVLHINQNIHTPEIQKNQTPGKLVSHYYDNGYSYYVVEYRSSLHVTEWQRKMLETLGEPVATFKPGSTGIMPAYLHSTTIVGYSQVNLLKLERFGPIVNIYKSTLLSR